MYGVNVKDEDGVVHGKSKVAAQEGIGKCCASRVVWNIPSTGLMPILIARYLNSSMHRRAPWLSLPVQTAFITVGAALGVYPGQVRYLCARVVVVFVRLLDV